MTDSPNTMGWQPIETAPKDGTDILIYNGRVCFTYWATRANHILKEDGWLDFVDDGLARIFYDKATHWMPLPEPPEGEL